MKRIIVLFLVAVACFFGGVACREKKETEAVADKQVVAGFESMDEMFAMSFRGEFGKVELNEDPAYVTQGKYSAKMTLKGEKNVKTGEYGKVWFHVNPNSAYADVEKLGEAGALCVDIYNAGERALNFKLGYNYTTFPFSAELKQGKNALRFEIPAGLWGWEEIAKSLTSFDFVFEGRGDDPVAPIVYVDNFRYELLKASEKAEYTFYDGDLEFNTDKKEYASEEFVWARGGALGGQYTYPEVENGGLSITLTGTPLSFCFSATEQLKDYQAGETLLMEMRVKFSDERGNFCSTVATESWSPISGLGEKDEEGYRTILFATSVNYYRQEYMFLGITPTNAYYKEVKNFAFSLHFSGIPSISDNNYPVMTIDYIRIRETYRGDWSFDGGAGLYGEEKIASTGNVGYNYTQPEVADGILHFKSTTGLFSVALNADGLSAKAGSLITLETKLKLTAEGSEQNFYFCGAAGNEEWTAFGALGEATEDGYRVFRYTTTINGYFQWYMTGVKAPSAVGYKAYKNVCFTVHNRASETTDVWIDYVKVISVTEAYDGGWEFDSGEENILTEDTLKLPFGEGYQYTKPQIRNGSLTFGITTEDPFFVGFNAESLTGYAVGDTVTLEVRMKLSGNDNAKFFALAGSSASVPFGSLGTPDGEGFVTFEYTTKVNGYFQYYMLEAENASMAGYAEYKNVGFTLQANGATIEIDYIRVVTD